MVDPGALARTLETAMRHHRGGQPSEAERLYRHVLAQDPGHAPAAFLLGLLALESGRPEHAVELFAQAVAAGPDNAVYRANLGEAERRLHRFGAAAQSFLKAMSLKPDLLAPVHNLGLLLQERGAIDGAIACFERAAELAPNVPDVAQRLAAALAARRGAAVRKGRRPSPEESWSVSTLIELSKHYAMQGRRDDAMRLLGRAIEIHPRSAIAHANLGVHQAELGQLDGAIASHRRALEIQPDLVATHHNLGNALVKSGLLDEGFASYRRGLARRPDEPAQHSNLVFYQHFHPDADPRAALEEARAWDRRHGAPLSSAIVPHENDRAPERRLRIGYVSPDFRQHCQALFLFPVLAHHDHPRFEIFCYSDVARPDEWTARLLGHADHARNIVGVDDAAIAARIRADRVDILVDLTMHMAQNHLRVFARKPAPIQVCWLAYPGTTGLSAMDYRITDPFLDPPESDAGVYSEQSIRLPDTFWCYHPLTTDAAVSPLPARENGHVRFGCLNSFFKVNDATIALWARVMREVEGSRFVLLAPIGSARTRILERFEQHGIDRTRIELVGHQPRLPYLATYRSIDVCLDTSPYNGHTTSLDAFWMGVPVVTLVGKTVVGRAGLCQAMNLGLPGLVARTGDQYVQIAVEWAKDRNRLADLRAGLRARMEASPLMDAPRFTANLEAAYRTAWKSWCEGAGEPR